MLTWFRFTLLLSFLIVLWGCGPSRADYRLNCAAGGVCTFKSTVAAGVNTQHVIVDSVPAGSGSATEAKQDSQITQETAINTLLGLQADAVCGTDDGACTLAALVKRLNQRTTTINTTLGTPLQAGGAVSVSGSVAVTGTFFQATQPVSIAVSPALVAGSAIIGNVRIDQTTSGTTNGVVVNSSALPTGGATEGKQDTGNTSLGTIATNTTVASTIASGQISVANTSTAVVAVRSGRKAVTIVNHGTTDVFIGITGVSTATGALLPGTKGAALTISGGAAIFGIVASGTQTVSFMESF